MISTRMLARSLALLGLLSPAVCAETSPAPKPLASSIRAAEAAISKRDAAESARTLKELAVAIDSAKKNDFSTAHSTCWREAEARAWSAQRGAGTGAWKDASVAIDLLWSEAGRCGMGAASVRLDSVGDAAWAVDRADARLSAIENKAARPSLCSSRGESPLEPLIKGLADNAYTPMEIERLRSTVGDDLVQYMQREGFASGDPSGCDRWSAVEENFVSPTESAAKCGTFRCRQAYSSTMLTRAFSASSPTLEADCRSHLAGYKPELAGAHTNEVCAIVAANISDPKKMCDRLVPRYLTEVQRESCVSEFSRYSAYKDEAACKPLESWPGNWVRRCHDIVAYRKALAAGRPELCGNSETCSLFMGSWKGQYAASEGRALAVRSCLALNAQTQTELDEAAALIDSAARVASAHRAEEGASELLKRTTALRGRATRLASTAGASNASSASGRAP